MCNDLHEQCGNLLCFKKIEKPGVRPKLFTVVLFPDLGADLPSLKTLRDTEWNNLRRSALKRFIENQKTGARCPTVVKLGSLKVDVN